jgi:GLPGLI family protein
MKNILFILILVFPFISTTQILEGHVTYSIAVTSDNPDMQMVIGMLNDSKMEVYFSKSKTRSEMNMGAVMSITTISDLQKDTLLMLMGGMAGQNAIKSTISEMKKETDSIKYKVTLLNDTKSILDYSCKKAIVEDPDGNESTYWYTTEINVSKEGQTYLNSQVPGFPMEFELNNNGVKMVMTVSTIDKKLDKKTSESLFQMTIPEGFQLISKEDLINIGR